MKLSNTIKYYISILLIFCNIVLAQEEVDENNYRRTLGEHYFTVSNTLGSPFILTSLTSSLGVGGANDLKYQIPIGDKNDEKYLQGDLTLALLSFEYKHGVKDWLAVYFGFEVDTRLGSDFVTLFKEGINYSSVFNIGWLVKIIRSEKFAVAADIRVTNGLYSIISIENFAEDIKNGNEDASLIVDRYSTSAYVAANAAYGLSQFLGFNGLVSLGYGESLQKSQSNKFFANLGLELDMNFTELINAPLSVLLGYQYSTFPGDSSILYFYSNIFFGQICYIGRSDFILSLDFTMSREDSVVDDNVIVPVAVKFSMKYLF